MQNLYPFTTPIDLYPDLQYKSGVGGTKSLVRTDGLGWLPGAPRVPLHDTDKLVSYINFHLVVSELEQLAPYLFLAATPKSSHVWPLHRYPTKGREIVVDEDPRLHLLWHKDKVYVKPIPPYLLSAAFWDYLQTVDESIFKAALGFMRTYGYLIRYEIDFRKATSAELGLIPTPCHQNQNQTIPLTFEAFSQFLSPFEKVSDDEVSPRYSYGQLRLARVNHLTRLVLWKWSYLPRYSRLADELGYFIAAVLALFSVASIFLNCMQVEIAVMSLTGEETWPGFIAVSRWFPVVMMALILLMLVVLPILAVCILLRQGLFTLLVLRAQRKDRKKARAMSSFVVG